MQRESDESLKWRRELSALPEVAPDFDAWPQIKARLRRKPTRHPGGWAMAAALVLGFGVWLGFSGGELPARGDTGNTAYWIAQSQLLTETLRDLDTRNRVLNGAQAQVAAALRQRLALVDAKLRTAPSAGPDAEVLWQQRTRLLAQLLAVKADQYNPDNTSSYVM